MGLEMITSRREKKNFLGKIFSEHSSTSFHSERSIKKKKNEGGEEEGRRKKKNRWIEEGEQVQKKLIFIDL